MWNKIKGAVLDDSYYQVYNIHEDSVVRNSCCPYLLEVDVDTMTF